MKRCLVIILVFYSPVLFGQEIYNGIVADSASFAPLPYVNVLLKGKNKGTITDQQGSFRIVATSADTLVLTYVGYQTLELSLHDWQTSIILLAEKPTLLNSVTIEERYLDPYEGMFDEENELLREQNKSLPFYYSRRKKQKIRIARLENENERVKTYVEVVIKNEETKKRLMDTYKLSEEEYYDLLGSFNARNYTVMYYLTAGELMTLLNSFFARNAPKR